jgi:hypothetical protein
MEILFSKFQKSKTYFTYHRICFKISLMNKLIPLLFSLLFLASCTNSKIYTSRSCTVCINPEDGILLLPLAWEPSFRQLSIAQKNQLERQILADLRAKGYERIELYDQLDYELLKAGIQDLNDPFQRAKIQFELGYSYLLGLSLGSTREGKDWSYQTEQEAFALDPVPDMEVSAILRIALIEVSSGDIVSDYTVVSKNSGFSIPDKDGGLDYWNFATISGVIQKGVRKGVDFLAKQCAC